MPGNGVNQVLASLPLTFRSAMCERVSAMPYDAYTLVTVVVGVFAYVLSMVLVQGWAYAVYDPYALPMLIDWENATRTPMFQWMGLYKPEWLSLLYSVLIAWGGLAFFKRVPVR